MKRYRWLIAILAAMALVAAACGSDDDDVTADDSDTQTTEQATDDTTADSTDEPADDGGEDAAALLTDIGVDDETIKVGFLSDLTGIFAGLTVPITDGSEAYFERLNDNGGIAGRQIETIVLDTGYDVPTHQQHYDTFSSEGADGVVMLGTSTGSPHTASIRDDLAADDLFAIPLSWNSSWTGADSANIFEWGANYCIEGMNGVSYLTETFSAETVAIVSFPGDYGEDGAIGAKLAAEALGLEVVYDGQAAVVPGADQTPVITGIVDSGADIVWTTINSTTLAEIMGGAAAAGFDGQWGGNGPSFSPLLLDTEVAALLDTNYTHLQPYAAIGSGGSAGMDDVLSLMRDYRADNQYLSVYVISWIQGEIVRQVLEAAAASGDMTRAGIIAAAQSTTIDMQGLMPNLTYSGDPNDQIIRSSFVFDVTLDTFNADATVLDDEGDGLLLVDGAYTSAVAAEWDYSPCFAI